MVVGVIAGRFGVDTVGLSFPVADVDLVGTTATVSRYGTGEESLTFRRQLEGGGFLATGVGGTCWVEASLPKRVGLWQALEPSAVPEVLDGLFSEACQFVTPRRADVDGIRIERSWRNSKVVRLDVVRDFSGVTGFSQLLDGLAAIRQPGRAKVRRYRDSDKNQAETLRVGPKGTWAATLYDKASETDGLAPPGSVRFEARLRSAFLRSKAAEPVVGRWRVTGSRIDDRLVEGLCRERWRHVGFGRTVSGTGSFVERINASDLSPREKRDLTAYICARALGIDLQFSRNTEGKYRRLAASLGVTVSLEDLDHVVSARLDLESGTQAVEGSEGKP